MIFAPSPNHRFSVPNSLTTEEGITTIFMGKKRKKIRKRKKLHKKLKKYWKIVEKTAKTGYNK